MSKGIVYSKTAKGVQELSGKTRNVSRYHRGLLRLIDGKASVTELQQKEGNPAELVQALNTLAAEGYIREVVTTTFPEATTDARADLDFTALQPAPSPPPAAREAAERAKREAAEQAQQEAEQQVKQLAKEVVRREARERAKREAAEQAQREAEDLARRQAEEAARRANEERVKLEAAERAQREAEQTAKRLADEARQREAEERARREAAEQARREAEEQAQRQAAAAALREAEERTRREAAEQAQRKAEEQARQQIEEAARRANEERMKREAAEKEAARLAEEAARRADEERVKREAAEKEAARLAEEATRRADEERVKREAAEKEAARLAEEAARRADEERVKREAAEQAKREAEKEAARLAEEAARREADERAQREADEHLRRQVEESARTAREADMKREAAEQARQEAEEAAKRIAAEAAQREADDRARREAEKRVWQQAEEAAQRTLRDAEKRAKKLAEETARREAAEQAKLEKAERKQREAKERARQKAAAEAERVAEERARRAGTKVASRQAAEQRATTQPLARRGRSPLNKLAAGALTSVVILGLVLIHIVPFNGRIPQLEAAITERLQHPVRINSLHFALLPQPHWRIEDVSVGTAKQIQAPRIDAFMTLAALFGDQSSFSAIDVEAPTVNAEGLGWLLFGAPHGPDATLRRLGARGVKLEGMGMALPALEVIAEIGAGGQWQKIAATAADKKLALELRHNGEAFDLRLTAAALAAPVAGMPELQDVSARGTVTRGELSLAEFQAGAFGGTLNGTARLGWQGVARFEGELLAQRVEAAQVLPGLFSSGQLEGKALFSAPLPASENRAAASQLSGNFIIRKGTLATVDVGRVLLGDSAGRTAFSTLEGNLAYDRGKAQLRQLRLVASAVLAQGNVDIAADNSLRGNVAIELNLGAQRRRGDFEVSGVAAGRGAASLTWKRR
jgi:hypothetical protein